MTVVAPPSADVITDVPSGFDIPQRFWLPQLPAGVFCRTADSLYAAQLEAGRIAGHILERYAEPRPGEDARLTRGHIASEADELLRMAPTNAHLIGWDHQPDGYATAPAGAVQAHSVEVWLKALLDAIGDAEGRPPLPRSIGVRVDKGKGCPVPGVGRALTRRLVFWAAGRSGALLDGDLERLVSSLAVGPRSFRRWAAKQIMRRQPRIKELPISTLEPHGTTLVGYAAKAFPKVRQAWMLPFPLNHRLTFVNDAWQALLLRVIEKRGPMSWAATFKAMPATLATLFLDPTAVYATDNVKWDLSIDAQAVLIASRLLVNWVDCTSEERSLLLDAVERLVGLPIFGSGYRPGEAVVYAAEKRRGRGLESGYALTSLIGTLVHWCLRRASEYGDSPATARTVSRLFVAGRAPYGRESIQSDDVLGRRILDLSRVGVTTADEGGAVFLKLRKRKKAALPTPLMGSRATSWVIQEHGGRGRFKPSFADPTLPETTGRSGQLNALIWWSVVAARLTFEPASNPVGHFVARPVIASLVADPELDRAWGKCIGWPTASACLIPMSRHLDSGARFAMKKSQELSTLLMSTPTSEADAERVAQWMEPASGDNSPCLRPLTFAVPRALALRPRPRPTVTLDEIVEAHGASKRRPAIASVDVRFSPDLTIEPDLTEVDHG